MTKAELIEGVAKEAGLSKADTTRAVNAFIGAVSTSLKKGGRVGLPGFGTWSVRARKARTGVNPRTGEKIQIKARKVVGWKTGKSLADMVK